MPQVTVPAGIEPGMTFTFAVAAPAQVAGVPVVGMQPVAPIPARVNFGRHPVALTCPFCGNAVQTNVNYEPGLGTWLLCGGTALVGLYCGCCLIPFCIDDLKDAQHVCPSCSRQVGVHKLIGS